MPGLAIAHFEAAKLIAAKPVIKDGGEDGPIGLPLSVASSGAFRSRKTWPLPREQQLQLDHQVPIKTRSLFIPNIFAAAFPIPWGRPSPNNKSQQYKGEK